MAAHTSCQCAVVQTKVHFFFREEPPSKTFVPRPSDFVVESRNVAMVRERMPEYATSFVFYDEAVVDIALLDERGVPVVCISKPYNVSGIVRL